MSGFARLASLDELAAGSSRIVHHAGRQVLLVHLEDQDGLRAYDARCPHARTLLADGPLVDGLIECPMHGALFHAADGTLEPGPVQCAGLTAFPVRVESGHIAVDLPEQPSEPRPHRPSSWGSFGTRTATSTSQP